MQLLVVWGLLSSDVRKRSGSPLNSRAPAPLRVETDRASPSFKSSLPDCRLHDVKVIPHSELDSILPASSSSQLTSTARLRPQLYHRENAERVIAPHTLMPNFTTASAVKLHHIRGDNTVVYSATIDPIWGFNGCVAFL